MRDRKEWAKVALKQSLNLVEIREKLASTSESVLGLLFICPICFWLRNGMLKTILRSNQQFLDPVVNLNIRHWPLLPSRLSECDIFLGIFMYLLHLLW
jgi:hypothetical protein